MNQSYIRVLGNVNFRMLFFGQIISQIALNVLSFVLAIQVYQKTQSNTAVSLMLLTFGIPAIIFGVMFGGIVDEFDKRSILVFHPPARFIAGVFFVVAQDHFPDSYPVGHGPTEDFSRARLKE